MALSKQNPIRIYLKNMAKRIRSRRARHKAYKELRDHFYSQHEKHISSGATPEESWNTVLKSATPAKTLGRRLDLAWRPWYWRYPSLTLSVVSFLLMLVAAVGATHWVYQRHYKPLFEASYEESKKYFDLFEADLKLLDKDPLFIYGPRTKNAAAYFQQTIKDSSYRGKTRWQEAIQKLSQRHYNWKEKPGVLVQLQKDMKLQALDLSWLDQLRDFDYWNIYELPEIHEQIQSAGEMGSIERLGVWSVLPMPNYSDLQDLLTFYILQARTQTQIIQRLELMYHTAQLSNTSETLIGKLVANDLLRREIYLRNYLKLPLRENVSLDKLEAHKRSTWGWAQVLVGLPLKGQEMHKRWKPYMRPELGMCVGVTEHPMGLLAFADLLYPTVPLEMDFRQQIEDAAIQRSEMIKLCQLEGLAPVVEMIDLQSRELIGAEYLEVSDTGQRGVAQYLPNLSRVPFVRRLLLFHITSVALPNYFAPYQKMLSREE